MTNASIILIFQMRKTGPGRGSDFPKVTELVNAGAEIYTQALIFQSLHLSIALNCMDNHNDNNSAPYCGILHQMLWLRHLVIPNIHSLLLPLEIEPLSISWEHGYEE